MQETSSTLKGPQNLILESRHKLTISGVQDINSYDEKMIDLITTLGRLIVRGMGLKMIKLSVETGDVIVEGEIDGLVYNQYDKMNGKNFWTRMLK